MRILLNALGAVAMVALAALAALSIAMSHTAPCGPVPPPPHGVPALMKGVTHRCYGSPQVLALEKVEKPVTGDDGILVRVHAVALNAQDWHVLRGAPYVIRLFTGLGFPKDPRVVAADFAGTVEAVGAKVQGFKVGDEVMGNDTHALGEYVTVHADEVILKPAGLSFEQAASIPLAGITALQALRDTGHVHAGEKVLINGASGGVGTFAVQIAKSFGAEVTGVCSTQNQDLARSLGADHVIDYTKEGLTHGTEHYGLVVDLVGNHPLADYRPILEPQGDLVLIGAPAGNWYEPFTNAVMATVMRPFWSQKSGRMLAHVNSADLTVLAGLVQSGKVKPVIDRHYTLDQAAQAMEYLEDGHARGKVLIDVDSPAGEGGAPLVSAESAQVP